MYETRTKELTLNGVTIGGFTINATIKATIADQGIGAYEFWGFCGTHHDMAIDEIDVIDATWADEENENPPKMTAKEFLDQNDNKIWGELYVAANDAWAADAEGDDDGPDPDDERDLGWDR